MRRIERYFYDNKGNKINYSEGYQKDFIHDELAREIINNNPDLLKEYNEISRKGVISESVFLVMKGYIYVGGIENSNMSAMYSSISLSENTKKIMQDLYADNYYIYDIIRSELNDSQKNQIKEWAKNGLERNIIINRVMTDMIVFLSPTKNADDKEDSCKSIDEK